MVTINNEIKEVEETNQLNLPSPNEKTINNNYDIEKKKIQRRFRNYVYLILLFGLLVAIDWEIGVNYFNEKQENIYDSMIDELRGQNVDNIERVYFSDEILEILNKRILNEEAEFTYCLDVIQQKGDNSTFAVDIEPMDINYRNDVSVGFNGCNTKVMIHSHIPPKGTCSLSNLDEKQLSESNLQYSCIICGEDKIACYNRDIEKVKVIL